MEDRNLVTKKNNDQLKHLLIKHIMAEDIDSAMNLTYEMFMNGLSEEMFHVCIEVFIYNCCIYIPDYINLLLEFEQNIYYYYRIVLHLIYSPKSNVFQQFPDHIDNYFYLQLFSQPNENKELEDNKMELDKMFDKYYKSITYYMSNININNQNYINKDFSDVLYYLYFHNNYEEYSKTLWMVQFNLFKEPHLIEYARKFNILEDFVQKKKLKLMMLYYTLQFRFLDISSVVKIYHDNDIKISNLIKNKNIIRNYLSPKINPQTPNIDPPPI